ncbi:hypothetical protein AB0J68_02965 [Micromonospora sp. NPDC049580]|uniref:hypothetical protein n=1 Tax=unclassified Micromonospora TaxID=2617518 RepID=UPI003447558F
MSSTGPDWSSIPEVEQQLTDGRRLPVVDLVVFAGVESGQVNLCQIGLQVVRVFEHPDGEEDDLSGPVDGLEKLAGQHQLFGWHVDGRVLEFLRLTRAELDVDEYAYG